MYSLKMSEAPIPVFYRIDKSEKKYFKHLIKECLKDELKRRKTDDSQRSFEHDSHQI